MVCSIIFQTFQGTSVLSPIIPFSFVVVPAYIIYRKSAEHVYENHPALYILAFGMVAAKVTNRLVVSRILLLLQISVTVALSLKLN